MTRRRLLLLALLLSLAGAAAGLAWLLATEAGLHWGFARLAAALEGRLSVGQLSGRLLGPVSVEELRYREGRLQLDLAQGALEWNPAALLAGRVRIERLEATGVTVALPPGSEAEPSTAPELPRLAVPLPVFIERLRVEQLRVTPAGGAPLETATAELAAILGPEGVQLTSLTAAGPWGELEAVGSAGADGQDPVELTARFRLDQLGLAAPLSGETQVRGQLIRPRVVTELTAPLRARLEATLAWSHAPLRWQLTGSLEPVALAAVRADLPDLTVGGRLQGEGSPDQFAVEGGLDLTGEAGPWRLDFAAARDGTTLRLPRLQLAARDRPARVEGKGLLTGSRELSFDLAWHDLAWPPVGPATAASPEGRLLARGPWGRVALNGEATLDGGGAPPARVTLAATLGETALDLHQFAADWLEGRWIGSGRFAWGGAAPAWQARLSVLGADPGRLDPRWPGTIDAAVDAQGVLGEEGQLGIELERLSGRLRGQPLAGKGRLSLAGERLSVAALELRSGEAVARLDGSLGERWDLAWRLEAPKLAELLPEAAGRFAAQGRLSGARAAPALSARIEGSALRLGERQIDSLRLDAELAASGERFSLTGEAKGVSAASVRLSRLTLDSDGGADRHQLRLVGEGPGTGLRLIAEGRWREGQWRGELREGRLDLPAIGLWSQEGTSAAVIGPDLMELKPWCWRAKEGRVCLEGRRNGGEARLAARGETLPLALLTAGRPELEVKGGFGFEARAGLAGGRVKELLVTAAAGEGELRYRAGEESLTSPFRRIELALRQSGADLAGELALRFASGSEMEARLRLGEWQAGPLGSRPLGGELALDLNHLAWIAPVVQQVSRPVGQLRGRLRLGGRVAEPTFDGQLTLVNGGFVLPDAGIALTGVELTLESRPAEPGVVRVQGRARSGPGSIDLQGRLNAGAAGLTGALQLTGERFLAAHLPAARVLVSPDLRVALAEGLVEVKGRVRVPEADIHLPEIPRSVTVSEDVVVVDRPLPEAAPGGGRLRAEIRLELGEKVQIQGYGLTGRLTGAVTLVDQPDAAPRGAGELRVEEGRYEAYGQKLELTEGRLLFGGGPVTEAALDVKAVRKIEEEQVEAGVSVTGNAKRPEVRLFSRPAMDESDILSYLVLGHPLRSASREEAGDLSQAALTLAGGGRLAKRIAGQFGIDEVNVGRAGANGGTALMLGKYLSPRLYVQYLVGLGQAASSWRLRYRWTERWSLEAQTGPRGGADILYTIER